MPVVAYLVLLLALVRRSSATYCLCKDGVSDNALLNNINYACNAGADCGPIQPNGACYNPNTLKDHCHYAVNSYFQRKAQTGGTCDFGGTATTSASPPTTVAAGCAYPSSSTSTGTTTPTPATTTGSPSITGTPSITGAPPPPPSIYAGLGPTGLNSTSRASTLLASGNLLFRSTVVFIFFNMLWH